MLSGIVHTITSYRHVSSDGITPLNEHRQTHTPTHHMYLPTVLTHTATNGLPLNVQARLRGTLCNTMRGLHVKHSDSLWLPMLNVEHLQC